MGDVKAFTMRLDAKLLDRVDQVAERYARHVAAGHTGHVLSRAQMMRLAIQLGLDAVEAKMKKSGSK
jgi:predicted transcriptional regulator